MAAYYPFNPGQQPMSSSQGVVIANDQSPVSVTGTVNIGPTSVAILQGTNPLNVVGSIAVMGVAPHSVAALQSTNPWIVQLTSGSVITTGGNSSVQVVGLIPPSSVSGVGTFNINPIGAGSVFAVLRDSSVAALQGTNPWFVQLTSGSVITTGGNSSVQVNNIVTGNSSVYLIPGVGILGSVATLQGTNPWVISNSSVYLTPGVGVLGSVAALQGTSPWLVTGSVMAVLSGGSSMIAVLQAPSIAGTYTEDSAHTGGDRGLFVFGVRNDTVASFVSADLDYTPFAHDSAGRVLMKPFAANEANVYGVSSTVNTGPSSLLGLSGAGLRNYITDIWLANTGSVATLVTFRDVDASVIGKTIAPGGGGSNTHLATPMRTHALNSQVEYTAATATSVLHVTAFGYKAP